jgi:hypothetical protein
MSSAMFDALHDANAGVEKISRVVKQKADEFQNLQEAVIRGQDVIKQRVIQHQETFDRFTAQTFDSLNDTNNIAAKIAVQMRDLERFHEERNLLFAERELEAYAYMVASVLCLFIVTHDAAQLKSLACVIVLMAFAEYSLYPRLHAACRGFARGNLLHVDSRDNNIVINLMAVHPAFWPLPSVPLRGAARWAFFVHVAYKLWCALFARTITSPSGAAAGLGCVNCSCARCGNKPVEQEAAKEHNPTGDEADVNYLEDYRNIMTEINEVLVMHSDALRGRCPGGAKATVNDMRRVRLIHQVLNAHAHALAE